MWLEMTSLLPNHVAMECVGVIALPQGLERGVVKSYWLAL